MYQLPYLNANRMNINLYGYLIAKAIGISYIEDIYFFEVNTKYISSSAGKKSVFFTSAKHE